jgi:Zn-dependent M28 family amino/carboxypeptidase
MRMTFLIVIPVIFMLQYMIGMPGKSYHGPVAPLTSSQQTVADRMHIHVRVIASEEHNTRHLKALADAAKYIETQLAEMEYPVAVQAFESGEGEVHNIEVEIKGRTMPEQIVVVGAHYDSARGAPGANDNASGTAMLLELARSLRGSHPKRTLRLVFFTNEEPPYFSTAAMGSLVYANRSKQRGENIVAMLSLETVGYYDDAVDSQKYPSIFKPFFPSAGNFVAFVGDLNSRGLVHNSIAAFRAAQQFPSEGIAAFPWIKGVDWSDHSSFWKNGYKALMITDTAVFRYPYYHSYQDTPDRLNYRQMAKVLAGVQSVVADLLDSP